MLLFGNKFPARILVYRGRWADRPYMQLINNRMEINELI